MYYQNYSQHFLIISNFLSALKAKVILELLLLRFVWIFRPNDPICDIFVYLQTMLIPEPKIIKKVLWVKWFSEHNYFKQWISQKNRNLLIQWVFQIQFIVFNLVWLIIKHICSVLFLIIFGFLNIFMLEFKVTFFSTHLWK